MAFSFLFVLFGGVPRADESETGNRSHSVARSARTAAAVHRSDGSATLMRAARIFARRAITSWFDKDTAANSHAKPKAVATQFHFSEDPDAICPVCQCEGIGEDIASAPENARCILPCGHPLHLGCAQELVRNAGAGVCRNHGHVCPTCRQPHFGQQVSWQYHTDPMTGQRHAGPVPNSARPIIVVTQAQKYWLFVKEHGMLCLLAGCCYAAFTMLGPALAVSMAWAFRNVFVNGGYYLMKYGAPIAGACLGHNELIANVTNGQNAIDRIVNSAMVGLVGTTLVAMIGGAMYSVLPALGVEAALEWTGSAVGGVVGLGAGLVCIVPRPHVETY